MEDYKIIAIHKPTKSRCELGTYSTIADALYALDNDVVFDADDIVIEWAFQVVDKENTVVAYVKTIYEASKTYQEAVNDTRRISK